MTAIFYKYKGDNLVVNKTSALSDPTSEVTLKAYEPIDDLSGYIITSKTYDGYNYMKLTVNGHTKYYFITDRKFDTAQRCIIYLREDVLMTLKADILKLDVIFDRVTTTTIMQAAMPDNLPVQQYKMTTEYTFNKNEDDFHYGDPTRVNTLDFILVVSGKGVI